MAFASDYDWVRAAEASSNPYIRRGVDLVPPGVGLLNGHEHGERLRAHREPAGYREASHSNSAYRDPPATTPASGGGRRRQWPAGPTKVRELPLPRQRSGSGSAVRNDRPAPFSARQTSRSQTPTSRARTNGGGHMSSIHYGAWDSEQHANIVLSSGTRLVRSSSGDSLLLHDDHRGGTSSSHWESSRNADRLTGRENPSLLKTPTPAIHQPPTSQSAGLVEALLTAFLDRFGRSRVQPVVGREAHYTTVILEQSNITPLVRFRYRPPCQESNGSQQPKFYNVHSSATRPEMLRLVGLHAGDESLDAHPKGSGGPLSPDLQHRDILFAQTFPCDHCGAKQLQGIQCHVCGGPLPSVRECGSCLNLTRGRFCSHCGVPGR